MAKYNLFAGTENGTFKGINSLSNLFTNLNDVKKLTKQKEILKMCWKNVDTQEEIAYATKDGYFYTYKLTFNEIDQENQVEDLGQFECGEGLLKGIECVTNNLITCTELGVVNVWDLNEDRKSLKSFNVGDNVSIMKKCRMTDHLIATGGRENDLKVWNIESETNENVFKAKNLPDNWIQLKEPTWVLSIDFYEESKLIVGTGHHQVRLYDTKCGMRRPVINMNYGERPISALCVCPFDTNNVIVGNTFGEMEMIDLRKQQSIKKYKNFNGTIKDIQIRDKTVASCGLDRFLRIHDIVNSKLLNRVYLKSRANCLLYSKHEPLKLVKKEEKKRHIEDEIEDDLVSDINSEDLGTNELWSDLESIDEKHPQVFNNRNSTSNKRKMHSNQNEFKKPRKFCLK